MFYPTIVLRYAAGGRGETASLLDGRIRELHVSTGMNESYWTTPGPEPLWEDLTPFPAAFCFNAAGATFKKSLCPWNIVSPSSKILTKITVGCGMTPHWVVE